MVPFVVLVVTSLFNDEPREHKPVLFPPHVFLVHAKAVEVKDGPDSREQKSLFQIDRVYVGTDQLKGKRFHVSVPYGFDFTGVRYSYLRRLEMIQKDEEGIWWIREDPIHHTLSAHFWAVPSAYSLDRYAPGFPYRDPKRFRLPEKKNPALVAQIKMANAHYQAGVRWAEAIERVYRAKSQADQIDLLKKYASTKNSPIAAWVVWALSLLKPADLGRFLREGAENRELSVWSQTVIDTELSRLDGRAWQRSPKRLAMLQRWVKKEIPDSDQYQEGIMRVRIALRDDELDSSTFLQVFKAGMEVLGKLTKNQKDEFTYLLEQIQPFEARDKRLLFDYLTELVHSSDAEVRNSAANGLRFTAPFDERQLATLRKLRETTRESKVGKVIDELLSGDRR